MIIFIYSTMSCPDEYGDFVIVLGGLHSEIAVLKIIGKLDQGSEWTLAIEESGVEISRTAKSFLHALMLQRPEKLFK